ncbi:DUF5914 domain-containing protein, partial [Streptomyces griseus]|uniref:DUF5914 domain-containing protein n=1 Tax=Streptomyces griseus TaxID=1911 RepID=UPI003F4CF9D7
RCEPQDVVANRLDPWHGAWFHPYSFVDLTAERPAPRRTSDAFDCRSHAVERIRRPPAAVGRRGGHMPERSGAASLR